MFKSMLSMLIYQKVNRKPWIAPWQGSEVSISPQNNPLIKRCDQTGPSQRSGFEFVGSLSHLARWFWFLTRKVRVGCGKSRPWCRIHPDFMLFHLVSCRVISPEYWRSARNPWFFTRNHIFGARLGLFHGATWRLIKWSQYTSSPLPEIIGFPNNQWRCLIFSFEWLHTPS